MNLNKFALILTAVGFLTGGAAYSKVCNTACGSGVVAGLVSYAPTLAGEYPYLGYGYSGYGYNGWPGYYGGTTVLSQPAVLGGSTVLSEPAVFGDTVLSQPGVLGGTVMSQPAVLTGTPYWGERPRGFFGGLFHRRHRRCVTYLQPTCSAVMEQPAVIEQPAVCQQPPAPPKGTDTITTTTTTTTTTIPGQTYTIPVRHRTCRVIRHQCRRVIRCHRVIRHACRRVVKRQCHDWGSS